MAIEDLPGTIVKIESNNTKHKPQKLSKFVFKSSSDMKSGIKSALADLGVMTRTNVKTIAETYLAKKTNNLQVKIFKAIECRFEEALHERI